jgi:probable phosphoglycerate mutase
LTVATAATRVCIVRHGETPWNVERRIQGHIDTDLSETGVRQAEALAGALARESIDALICSDLRRARQTAAPLERAHGLWARVSADWRERAYGVFEGMTYAEAKVAYPDDYARVERRDPAFAFAGGGESLERLAARVVPAFDALAERWVGQTVVVITHGGVLDIINRHVRGVPLPQPRDFVIANAGLNWFEHGARGWRLTAWGDVNHLDCALDELR